MKLQPVPYVLIGIRFLAGPLLVALAYTSGLAARPACVALLAVGVVSDVFDGMIARRIGSVTDRLRTFDSRTDLVFWVCVTVGVLILHPALISSTWPMVAILGAMEMTTHTVSFLRFRREASPHHLLSKLFGLGLWALLTQLIVFGDGGWLKAPVFALGVASQLEALAIMLMLPVWRADVRGIRHALDLRTDSAGAGA